MRELAHVKVRAKPDGQMESPEPTIRAPWGLFVSERAVLRCKQKQVSHQVFKMLGAWSPGKGSDGTMGVTAGAAGAQSEVMQIRGSVQVSTWQYSHCNPTNSWLGFPGIWGVMVT